MKFFYKHEIDYIKVRPIKRFKYYNDKDEKRSCTIEVTTKESVTVRLDASEELSSWIVQPDKVKSKVSRNRIFSHYWSLTNDTD